MTPADRQHVNRQDDPHDRLARNMASQGPPLSKVWMEFMEEVGADRRRVRDLEAALREITAIKPDMTEWGDQANYKRAVKAVAIARAALAPAEEPSTYPPNYPDAEDPTGPPTTDELLGTAPAEER